MVDVEGGWVQSLSCIVTKNLWPYVVVLVTGVVRRRSSDEVVWLRCSEGEVQRNSQVQTVVQLLTWPAGLPIISCSSLFPCRSLTQSSQTSQPLILVLFAKRESILHFAASHSGRDRAGQQTGPHPLSSPYPLTPASLHTGQLTALWSWFHQPCPAPAFCLRRSIWDHERRG